MATETLILLSLLVPLLTAVGIAVAGRWPNLREGVTLTGALLLALVVYSLLPSILAGERPELVLLEMMPLRPAKYIPVLLPLVELSRSRLSRIRASSFDSSSEIP